MKKKEKLMIDKEKKDLKTCTMVEEIHLIRFQGKVFRCVVLWAIHQASTSLYFSFYDNCH